MLSTTSPQLVNTQTAFDKQDVIKKLIELDSKNEILLNRSVSKEDLLAVKTKMQQELNRLRKLFRLMKILIIICFVIPAIFYLVKIFNQTVNTGFNEAAYILILISNLFIAYSQHIRIEKLKQQISLLDFLDKADT